ncbi:hypothetical protein ACKI2N_000565 [Cupriavidus sp. 30B13]|uniref:hypothetical protein n=1 Tax=Cupriavidus sp. 30B13 TaxID=3384241 RepID=UPI003B907EFF
MSKTLLALLLSLSFLSACGGDDGANTGVAPAVPSPQVPAGDAVIRCAPAPGQK